MDRRYVPDWVFLMLISIFGLGFIQLHTSFRKLQLGLDLFVKTDLTYFGYWFPFNSCFKLIMIGFVDRKIFTGNGPNVSA